MPPINATTLKFEMRPARGRGTPDRYVRGPLSLAWLATAARLPGRALHVAVWLLYRSGLEKSQTVKLTGVKLFGLTRWTCQRGLKQLEGAKLVKVQPRTGKTPLVTLLGAAHVQRDALPQARRRAKP